MTEAAEIKALVRAAEEDEAIAVRLLGAGEYRQAVSRVITPRFII